MLVLFFVLLLVSFYVLYRGADWLVDGASKLATNLGISKVVVGVTMVAFGTSAPELFVNLIAAVRGRTDFALSNVSGSNLTNICMGFGICSVMGTLIVLRKDFLKDLILFAVAPLLILLFILVHPVGFIPVWAVLVLGLPFGWYIHSLKSRLFDEFRDETVVKTSTSRSLLIFLLGIVSLYIGGELVLKSAISIGKAFNLSDSVMGLTIVAIGTSIPDVTASIIAFRKNENHIAVGNLIGSNIFNILLVISGTILISFKGLAADKFVMMDFVAVLICTLFFTLLALIRQKTGRMAGIVLLIAFFSYMTIRIWLSMTGA